MKHFGFLCTFLILIHFSTQTAKFVNCPEDIKTTNTCECCKVECSTEGTDIKMQALACPLVLCAEGSRYLEDKTKMYPDCCGNCITDVLNDSYTTLTLLRDAFSTGRDFNSQLVPEKRSTR